MNKILKTSIFFIFAYVIAEAIVYFLSKDNFFTSPMYILLPIVGFFGLFFITPLIEEYTKWNGWVIFTLFIVISLFAYWLVAYIYAYEIYVVLNNSTVPKDIRFWNQLITSAFFSFVIAGAIGIIASKK
ncbi:MAG: hypothetical protein WCX82_00600 [archaeon]|jgi:hypothetical protein